MQNDNKGVLIDLSLFKLIMCVEGGGGEPRKANIACSIVSTTKHNFIN